MDSGLAANQVGCADLAFKVSISGTPEIDGNPERRGSGNYKPTDFSAACWRSATRCIEKLSIASLNSR
jgi:hypothetical protein